LPLAGETDSSWAYSSSEGKMVHNTTFEEYGEKFARNDIIGAFLDLDGDEISMTFTKNGEDQGDAFQIPKEKLGGRALFPHILSRNVKFEVNFGVTKANEDKELWKEKLEGEFVKVGKVEPDARVRLRSRSTSIEGYHTFTRCILVF
jgi:heterogeneous nuclear ribonucleoprotein U-like protein 1